MRRVLTYLFIALLFSACYKETRKQGCMDEAAANYDFFAEDSCCCLYKSKLTIWYDTLTRDSLKALGIKAVYFYQDESWHAEGHIPLRTDSVAPTCGNEILQGSAFLHLAGQGVSTKVNEGETKTIKVAVYGAYSDTSFQKSAQVKLWEKEFVFAPKGCQYWQLSF
ncbi:MAG: hypothetical protein ACKOXB_15460 [Flavobacteriales bacterium]